MNKPDGNIKDWKIQWFFEKHFLLCKEQFIFVIDFKLAGEFNFSVTSCIESKQFETKSKLWFAFFVSSLDHKMPPTLKSN